MTKEEFSRTNYFGFSLIIGEREKKRGGGGRGGEVAMKRKCVFSIFLSIHLANEL